MKKICISLFLLMSCMFPLYAWKWFDKNIANPIENAFKDPGKIAKQEGNRALKTVGVNVEGIKRNIDKVSSYISTINDGVNKVQDNLNASNGPLKKGPIIADKIQIFQRRVQSVVKEIDIDDVKKALSDSSNLQTVIRSITTNTLQDALHKLFDIYNDLIREIDSVSINPILQSSRQVLLDIATMLKRCLNIRKYAGTFAKIIISGGIQSAIEQIIQSLQKISSDLQKIEQGGARSLQLVQKELASKFVTHMKDVDKLIEAIKQSIKDIPLRINDIKTNINGVNTHKNALVAAASDIPSRLEKLMLKKAKTVIGVFDVPRAALLELQHIFSEIRGQLYAIIRFTSKAISALGDIVQEGVDGIQSFKRYIQFDIVPPASRQGLLALPLDIQNLSKAVMQLSRAV